MERKFSFVSNCIEGDSYALVMVSWKVDAEGNEVKEEKKETKANRVKDVDVVVNEEEVVEVDTTR